jgi:phage repressor protein C with HTH and peptisase S24 domain
MEGTGRICNIRWDLVMASSLADKGILMLALRCTGDSMKPRIKDGEYVVVEPNHQ